MSQYSFTSGSVVEGHPDKVCNYNADSILDAHLAEDRNCHLACAVLCKNNRVILDGEIKESARIAVEAVVCHAIAETGYTEPNELFHVAGVRIISLLGQQGEHRRRGEKGQSIVPCATRPSRSRRRSCQRITKCCQAVVHV